MIKLGICNELFEGWEFGRVCRVVKELGYDGWRSPRSLWRPLITDLSRARRRELKTIVEDAGLETIGLHWLLAKTEGFYLTTPDPAVRRATGDYLVALAEATRDLGGSLMVLGSPKQRDLLPGVTYDQAVGYAVEVFRANHAGDRSGWGRPLSRAAGAQRDQLPQHVRPGDGADPAGRPPSFQAAHGRQGPEQRAGRDRTRADPPVCARSPAISTPRMSTCAARHGRCRLRPDHEGTRRGRLRSVGLGRGIRLFPGRGRDRAAEHRLPEERLLASAGRVQLELTIDRVDRPCGEFGRYSKIQ